MSLSVGFIMFNPETTVRQLRENVGFLRATELASFKALSNRVIVYRGTQLEERLARRGILVRDVNQLYAEYARMATLVYQRCGLEGLLALVGGGRPEIKRVERLLFDGDLRFGLPEGRWESRYSDLLARVSLATVKNLVVSPLAKYVSRHVRLGADAESVARESAVPVELVKQAFDELQGSVMLMLTDDDRVDYTDIGSVVGSRWLRYAI